MTYSLNAHSPWEGYRVTVNGTEGRAELEVIERAAVLPGPDGRPILDAGSTVDTGADDPTDDPVRRRGERLTVQRHWEKAQVVPIHSAIDGGHGGGDALLLDDVFRGVFGGGQDDPLGRRAGYRDGLAAVVVGLAANASMRTGERVRIADLGVAAPVTPDGGGARHVGDR
jgi:hypothetical protein